MIKPVFYIVLIIFCFSIRAQQNLVYNGDFEIYDTCISNISHPNDLQINHCLGWTTPRKLGTSDYFNVCNNIVNSAPAGVPKNLLGFQQPLNGDGYCGLLVWVLNPDNTNYREYLQTKLPNSLNEGKIYKLKFYVSYYGNNYSVKKIGALFSEESFYENSWNPIISEPQIVQTGSFLSDTLTWMKIEGQFIASGNEEYLTIGYFEKIEQIDDTLNTYNDPFCQNQSYYYVDAVELIETNLEIPNVFTPNLDGINDVFSFDLWVDEFYIMNRWGNIVNKQNKTLPVWDGNDENGISMPEGNYFYVIKAGNFKKTGFIQLMR